MRALRRCTVTAGFVAAILMAPGAATAQAPEPPDLSPEHEAIAFLIGDWVTSSEWPDGRTAPGALRYEWVLGGGWMHVRFVGDHPDAPVWEAVAMQRFNSDTGEYESYSFPPGGPPVRYRGSLPEPGLFRIEITDDQGVRSGIDYHAREDGGVYQENWVQPPDGDREVTLRTRYRRSDSGGD